MRHLGISFLAFMLLNASLFAQITLGFHENFDFPGMDDSITSSQTTPGIKDWNLSATLQYMGGFSDTCQTKNNTTTYLTTQSFSTVGNSYVILEFAHIAKVDNSDYATISVSADGGATWTYLQTSQYMGSGGFASTGKFDAYSYGNSWFPGSPTTKPTNAWWRVEQFNLSASIPNCPNAKIRFNLSDGGVPGPYGNYGWCLDDLKIKMAFSETILPTVILSGSNPQGSFMSLGPFNISAKISDASGIDTAYVVYTINNNSPDTVGMSIYSGDTMVGVIPAVAASSTICYYVVGVDNSPAHNSIRNPLNSCVSFTAFPAFTFPYFNDFDSPDTLWTTSGTGTIWEIGPPAYGVTNSAHSPPNAWDVNLNTAYGVNAYCMLKSPLFVFTGVTDAILSFWVNYKSESATDGVRLEYSLNGINWNVLGIVNDPLATNWYSYVFFSTGKPGWSANSYGWKKCTYNLSQFNNVSSLFFRFVFTSDWNYCTDGFSLDDFRIGGPIMQGVALKSITNPYSACSLGTESVAIRIRNTAFGAINGGLTASYLLGNGNIVTENVPNVIQPGDSINYTFANQVTFPVSLSDSTYILKCWVNLINDIDLADDTLTKVIISKKTPNPPVLTDQYIPYATSTVLTCLSNFPVSWYDVPSGGTSLSTTLSLTTPVLYNNKTYYCEATGPSGCKSARVPVTVYLLNIPLNDGATVSVNSPPSQGYNMSNHVSISVLYKNFGPQTINNFTASYQLAGSSAVTESVNQPILSNGTLLYTFNTTADLSAFGIYHLKTWITIPGDTYNVNDSLEYVIVNLQAYYCNSSASSASDLDIGNVNISNLNNGNSMPVTFNTTASHTYSNFLTSVAPIQLYQGHSYLISISPVWQSDSYNASCKVFVDWNNNNLFDIASETAFTAGVTYTTPLTGIINVPADAYLGNMRFRVILAKTDTSSIMPCGNYQYGETEDYTATITVAPAIVDASVIGISQPPAFYHAGDAITPTVIIKNNGNNTINNFTVRYRIDNNAVITSLVSTGLAPGSIRTITFPVITPAGTSHIFKAYVSLPGDVDPVNDTLIQNIEGVPVYSIPYSDPFDGTSFTYTTTDNTSGTTWIKGAPQAGLFPLSGAHSSPNVWATNPGTGSYSANAHCELITSDFQLQSGYLPQLSFWFTTQTDTLCDGFHIEYSTDHGNTWLILGYCGDPWHFGWHWYSHLLSSNNQDGWSGRRPWTQAIYYMLGFNSGTVRFKFVFSSDASGSNGGAAIDDLKLIFTYQSDPGITDILSPGQGLVAGSNAFVSYRYVNFGLGYQYGLPASYQVNNGPIVSEFFAESPGISPMQSKQSTFSSQFIVPTGDFTLKVYIQEPNDDNHFNDTIVQQFHGYYPCQPVGVRPDSGLFSPAISASNSIYVCPNQSIHIAAKGLYPQNNLQYYQQDITSVFTWDFGDGSSGSGIQADHSYSSAGTYQLRMKIKDVNNCESQFINGPLVIVSTSPFADFTPVTPVCPNHQNTVTIGFSDTNNIKLISQLGTVALQRQLLYDSAVYVPDGGGNAGNCSNQSITIDLFPANATITATGDIHSIDVNLEHSYVGDLRLTLICPNGQSAILKNNGSGGGSYLGIPLGGALHYNYDCSAPAACLVDPVQNPPGTGWTYSFSIPAQHGVLNSFGGTSTSIPAGNYLSDQPFSNLIGCPVNGNWSLKACDYYNTDNGWVFNWKMNFNPAVLPDLSIYEPPLDTVIWSGPSIVLADNNHMTVQPPIEGTFTYHVTVINSIGCSHDTTFTVSAMEVFQASCGPDMSFPQGSFSSLSVQTDGAILPLTYLWSSGDTTQTITVATTNTTVYTVTVYDATGCATTDSINVNIGGCPMLYGQITYDNVASTPMDNTLMTLTHDDVLVSDTMTNNFGYYSITNICQPGNYKISANCTKPNGGYNSADALMVVNYFIGNSGLNAIQKKAADVDLSSVINAADALAILKRFVGMTSSFTAGDWVVENGDVAVGPYFNETKNLKALCTGDVDRSFVPGMKITPAISISTNQDILNPGVNHPFVIPVFVENTQNYHALSLILNYNPKAIKIEDVIPNPKLIEGNSSSFVFNKLGNELRIAWYSLEDIVIPQYESFFSIKAILCQEENLFLRISGNSSFADSRGEIIGDATLFIPKIVSSVTTNDLLIYPNPATESYTVNYYLGEISEVNIKLMNSMEQEVFQMQSFIQDQGEHELLIPVSKLPPGAYLCQLRIKTKDKITLIHRTLIVQ